MNTPVLMEALGYQKYDGVWYTIGQEIRVKNEVEAKDMEAMRLARRKKIAAVLQAPVQYETRTVEVGPAQAAKEDNTPEESPESLSSDRRKGKYQHRAVQARR